MVCSKCGNEIIQESRYCHNCGEKIERLEKKNIDVVEDKQIELSGDSATSHTNISTNENDEMGNLSNEVPDLVDKKKRSTKKRIITLTTWILIIAALGIGYLFGLPYLEYKHAQSLMEDNNYEQAIAAFTELEDYKNAAELIVENNYLYAKQLVEDKEYEKAKEVIDTINSPYKDSDKVRSQIDYLMGKRYLEANNYLKAIESFNYSENYKNSKQLGVKSRYLYGKELVDKKNYAEAISYFEDIKGYEDTNIILADIRYLEGIAQFNNGKFDDAEELFLANKEGYKDSEIYLTKMLLFKQLHGTWESESGYIQLIFSGKNVTKVFFPDSPDTKIYTFELYIDGDTVKESYGTTGYFLTKNHLYQESSGASEYEEYNKVSDHTFIPKEKPSPQIGMSASEVRSSNWGSPKDINKTVTVYGVSEQWVYDDYKYIYLDDGVVTSIQE